MSRLAFLEAQMDREDLSDEEFSTLNKELVAIYEQQDERRAMFELRRKEEQEEIELAKVLSLTEEQVDQMYQDSCLKYQDVNGLSFKTWYEQSLKYYSIDEKFNVHSKARSVEIVPNPTLAQAKLLILKRIRYKFYDHAVRGHDFAYEFDGGNNDSLRN
jgi:hypothetical protein